MCGVLSFIFMPIEIHSLKGKVLMWSLKIKLTYKSINKTIKKGGFRLPQSSPA
ncbi:hypothetical protein B194_1968 [Serratia plymuthica A30]|nr:hypothetical protein B194_1968 [Serratia plymuthica A30]